MKATTKGLVPHDHEVLAGKEFTSANEALAAVVDYVRDNPQGTPPANIVFVQIFDFSKP